MAYEVDFLAVGEGERSGDAIALRFGNLAGPRNEQFIAVIDGGHKESGEQLVRHIKSTYNTSYVDQVINTHPDIDHASGLGGVLENLDFGSLAMHKPWDHAGDICEFFKSNRLRPSGLSDKLEKAVSAAHTLQEVCDRKGKPVIEPFAGIASNDRSILVLGPSKDYYQQLIPQFRSTPEARIEMPSVVSKTIARVGEAVTWVGETLGYETLDESGETSAENNSSAIVLFTIDGQKLLFTGDAGIPALTAAADYAASLAIPLFDLTFMQVPHHGSKRNVSPSVLDRIKAKTAFISAAADGQPKHPAKKVTNALRRRGAQVFATAGKPLCHRHDTPARPGWRNADEVPFYDRVEA